MDIFAAMASSDCQPADVIDPSNNQKQITVQLVLSLAMGISAFAGFCILRPRWKGLYAARKRQLDAAEALPELPDSFFGWMPVLYKVTEQQVLATAGLDAFVMSIKFLSVTFLLTAIILVPINSHFSQLPSGWGGGENDTSTLLEYIMMPGNDLLSIEKKKKGDSGNKQYLWSYTVFTYVFTGLCVYFMIQETKRIIQVRQDYLGSQSTITDRTIRLSGIPKELRSEEKITEFLEKLEIGKVKSVTLCRDWKELDDLMDKRADTLRKLEESWAVHLGQKKVKRPANPSSSPPANGSGDEDGGEAGESDNLIDGDDNNNNNHVSPYDQDRPTTRLWYGFLKLQSRKVDAIDYFEEKLRLLDEKIEAARKKEYKATPLAFVTMDSIPACQMAVQAVLDPAPMQLLAKLAPAPSDVVWRNTYLPRSNRMIRSWIITIFIIFLTVFWLIPVGALAGLVSLCSIEKVSPPFAHLLERHDIGRSLVQTGLPTLIASLLNVAVPYLYDYLSNQQGSISQSDVELSVISKNFFFTFFNFFIVFTVLGTASNVWPKLLKDSLKDTSAITTKLANSVIEFGNFYVNFIMLQGIGLFPFRLLEFGSVSFYPISLMGAKTPRDYAELVQPPIFSYGFYLPTALLILILCIVYSILPAGFLVLLFGLIYFVMGYFVYKYQLLYAMDHPQHSTGAAWSMICYRIMLGLGIFQVTMASVIALQTEYEPAVLILPLLPCTIWFSYYFGKTFDPLIKYIALRSIRRESNSDINIAGEDIGGERPDAHLRRESTTIDEDREKNQKFVNPSLYVPLEKIWLNKNKPSGDSEEQPDTNREASTSSSLSLGDTHVWRESGDNNV